MNVSITNQLAGYVRKKVQSGRYNNASEVVRDALRRMQDEEARELRLARPAAEDLVAALTHREIDSIRAHVLAAMEQIESGAFSEYEGREGLNALGAAVKTRGQKLLQRK